MHPRLHCRWSAFYSLMHHIATETGNFLADPSFMCVDLSSAIKIYLIFTEMALYCWLLTSPSRLLQPLALTFSPAHKTPASSSTSGRSCRSSLPPSPPSLLLYLSIYCDLRYDSIFIGCVCVSPPPVLALFFPFFLLYCANTLSTLELFFLNCLFSSWMIDSSDLSDILRVRTILRLLL